MFDQQHTFDGGAEDIAPVTSQDHLFTAPTTMRGQITMQDEIYRVPAAALLPVGVNVDDYAAIRYSSTPDRDRYVKCDGTIIGWACQVADGSWRAFRSDDVLIGQGETLTAAAWLVYRAAF